MVHTAEFNHEDFDRSSQQRMDDTLAVRFFVKPVEDKAATEEAGRPIYKDVEYVDIRVPGSKDAVVRPARQRDINRFRRHYEAFKARTEGDGELPLEGTLLTEWPQITRSQCEELSFFNVKTVEQLAAISDSNSAQFMGVAKLKRKAQEWLALVKDQKASIELQQALKERDDQISELREQMEEMRASMDKPKPKRKRRTKAEMEADKESVDDSDSTGDS